MDRSFRSGIFLLCGIGLLIAGLAVHFVFLQSSLVTWALAAPGLALSAMALYALRAEWMNFLRGRRGEIALYTVALVGILCAVGWLSTRFPVRWDLTESGKYSLSAQTTTMLQRLEKPVHVTFFHDPMMRETVELYELMAATSKQVTVEFYDPMLNPAQARLRGVQFAGTALLESEGRKITINSPAEVDIANGILRVSRGITQRICFLEGHREADPFSKESHDHMEGGAGHTHGLGAQYTLHEQHGMAKARNALESMNYTVTKLSLMMAQSGTALKDCHLLVVAGPKEPLLPAEVKAIHDYLAGGGNAFFMLEPFIVSGLEPVLREFGIVLDNDIVIDEVSHFWADPSAPAVTDYNFHQVTRELPLTFFPGVRSLSPTDRRMPGTNVVPAINTSKKSYGETDRERAGFDEGKDAPGPLTLMVVATRKPAHGRTAPPIELGPKDGNQPVFEKGETPPDVTGKSRIAVVGDADFATNSFFQIMGNGKLFLNVVNYLAAQENLIGVEPRGKDLPSVNLTNQQMKGTFFLAVLALPLLLALLGTAMWWKQR